MLGILDGLFGVLTHHLMAANDKLQTPSDFRRPDGKCMVLLPIKFNMIKPGENHFFAHALQASAVTDGSYF